MGNLDTQSATLVFLSAGELSSDARKALEACAEPLGHKQPAAFVNVEGCSFADLSLLIHRIDPWSVVAVDDASVRALTQAFGSETRGFGPDNPVVVRGYAFVAVPGFEECLCNQELKRISWGRLKSAQYPAPPY